ncbi:MAG TPA: hypothetical protein VFQ61_28350 [Polyangiaceae bacterium]|nr:hypothetical protein [Polyangiaceae bacterium]
MPASKWNLGFAKAGLLGAMVLFGSTQAWAGVPECGGLRLEDVRRCEVRGSVSCQGGCSELGVYKKACATKLHKVCRSECTLAAEPSCSDECTVKCKQECDRGVPVTCIHNCFTECAGNCSDRCAGHPDPEQCVATCEATCDGECDMQCGALVDASCYNHCIECCGGACTAQANMDCQTTCQDEQFESCEYELKADCSASCNAQGALFCDGEYVLSASDIVPCATALSERGIAKVNVEGSVTVNPSTAAAAARGGCAMKPPARDGSPLGLLGLALGLFLASRFNKRRS